MVLLLPFLFSFAGCKKNNTPNNPPVNNDTIPVPVKTDVTFWMTRADRSVLFQKQTNTRLVFSSSTNSNPTIEVDTTQTYQSIDGFGFALTGASATLINSLPENQKDALLKELFLTD